jgi:hypothetical protein
MLKSQLIRNALLALSLAVLSGVLSATRASEPPGMLLNLCCSDLTKCKNTECCDGRGDPKGCNLNCESGTKIECAS